MKESDIRAILEISRTMDVENKTLYEAARSVLGDSVDLPDIDDQEQSTISKLENSTGLEWRLMNASDNGIVEYVSHRDTEKQVSYLEIPGESPRLAYGSSMVATSVSVEGSIKDGFSKLLMSVLDEIKEEVQPHIEGIKEDVKKLQEE